MKIKVYTAKYHIINGALLNAVYSQKTARNAGQKGGIMRLVKQFTPGLLAAFCQVMLILLCVNSYAQPVVLTPEEAVEIAVRNNLGLESSRADLEARRRASELSWNQFIPGVDIGGALIRLNNVPEAVVLDFGALMGLPPGMVEPISMGGGGSQWRMSGSLSMSLNFNFAMFEDMNKLRLDYEKGLISYNKAKTLLERDVRKAYHSMLLLQENIDLLRSNFSSIEHQVEIAQANYNAGLVPELTLLRAQVGRENMRPAIDQAENGLKLSMASFAMSLGMSYNTEFVLMPVDENIHIVPHDLEDIISRAVINKPEIQELRQDLLALESTRKSTWLRLFTPTVSLSLNFDPSFQGDPWKDSWFKKDSWKQQSGMFRITLGFRLNGLLPFSAERQGLQRIDDGITALNNGIAQMINGTEIEIYNIILSLERSITNMEVQTQAIRVAEHAYNLGEQAYESGLQDYSQVQSDQLALLQARVNLLEQQFNYLNSLIDLEYVIGVPFGTLSGRR